MVTLQEALQKIYALKPTDSHEVVSLENALGRVCAKEYSAVFDMPRFDNSAMDGYAVKVADAQKAVTVSGSIYAGCEQNQSVQDGSCLKIMTGAKLPKGCEAVVPIENVVHQEDDIVLPKDLQKGANMRYSGEDIKANSVIVQSGKKITPYDIGALASQGQSYIDVYKNVRISVLSSGHELKPHYEQVSGSQLYNSNAPTLEVYGKLLGCDVVSSLVVDDSFEGLKKALQNCLDSDIIVTTGGASVGDKDYTKEAIFSLKAQVVFENIAIKPGKPTSLYKVANSYILVLPGNPLAAMVNFELVGKALIASLQNRKDRYFAPVSAVMAQPYQKRGTKDTIVLGNFDGKMFTPLKLQLPGMVAPLQLADAFIVLKDSSLTLDKGQSVAVLPLCSSSGSVVEKEIFTK